jgi:hypothetical protein
MPSGKFSTGTHVSSSLSYPYQRMRYRSVPSAPCRTPTILSTTYSASCAGFPARCSSSLTLSSSEAVTGIELDVINFPGRLYISGLGAGLIRSDETLTFCSPFCIWKVRPSLSRTRYGPFTCASNFGVVPVARNSFVYPGSCLKFLILLPHGAIKGSFVSGLGFC